MVSALDNERTTTFAGDKSLSSNNNNIKEEGGTSIEDAVMTNVKTVVSPDRAPTRPRGDVSTTLPPTQGNGKRKETFSNNCNNKTRNEESVRPSREEKDSAAAAPPALGESSQPHVSFDSSSSSPRLSHSAAAVSGSNPPQQIPSAQGVEAAFVMTPMKRRESRNKQLQLVKQEDRNGGWGTGVGSAVSKETPYSRDYGKENAQPNEQQKGEQGHNRTFSSSSVGSGNHVRKISVMEEDNSSKDSKTKKHNLGSSVESSSPSQQEQRQEDHRDKHNQQQSRTYPGNPSSTAGEKSNRDSVFRQSSGRDQPLRPRPVRPKARSPEESKSEQVDGRDSRREPSPPPPGSFESRSHSEGGLRHDTSWGYRHPSSPSYGPPQERHSPYHYRYGGSGSFDEHGHPRYESRDVPHPHEYGGPHPPPHGEYLPHEDHRGPPHLPPPPPREADEINVVSPPKDRDSDGGPPRNPPFSHSSQAPPHPPGQGADVYQREWGAPPPPHSRHHDEGDARQTGEEQGYFQYPPSSPVCRPPRRGPSFDHEGYGRQQGAPEGPPSMPPPSTPGTPAGNDVRTKEREVGVPSSSGSAKESPREEGRGREEHASHHQGRSTSPDRGEGPPLPQPEDQGSHSRSGYGDQVPPYRYSGRWPGNGIDRSTRDTGHPPQSVSASFESDHPKGMGGDRTPFRGPPRTSAPGVPDDAGPPYPATPSTHQTGPNTPSSGGQFMYDRYGPGSGSWGAYGENTPGSVGGPPPPSYSSYSPPPHSPYMSSPYMPPSSSSSSYHGGPPEYSSYPPHTPRSDEHSYSPGERPPQTDEHGYTPRNSRRSPYHQRDFSYPPHTPTPEHAHTSPHSHPSSYPPPPSSAGGFEGEDGYYNSPGRPYMPPPSYEGGYPPYPNYESPYYPERGGEERWGHREDYPPPPHQDAYYDGGYRSDGGRVPLPKSYARGRTPPPPEENDRCRPDAPPSAPKKVRASPMVDEAYHKASDTPKTPSSNITTDDAASVLPNSTSTQQAAVLALTGAAALQPPKAASEIDFDVTSPPTEPITPPSSEPVCNAPSGVNTHDVLCGRGGGTNTQIGNRRFRALVTDFQPIYLMARRKEKPLIARSIVLIIRNRGGRFLKKDENTGMLFEVGDEKAEAKTSQALREGLDVRATKSAANNLLRKEKQAAAAASGPVGGKSKKKRSKEEGEPSSPDSAGSGPSRTPRGSGSVGRDDPPREENSAGGHHPYEYQDSFRKRRRLSPPPGPAPPQYDSSPYPQPPTYPHHPDHPLPKSNQPPPHYTPSHPPSSSAPEYGTPRPPPPINKSYSEEDSMLLIDFSPPRAKMTRPDSNPPSPQRPPATPPQGPPGRFHEQHTPTTRNTGGVGGSSRDRGYGNDDGGHKATTVDGSRRMGGEDEQHHERPDVSHAPQQQLKEERSAGAVSNKNKGRTGIQQTTDEKNKVKKEDSSNPPDGSGAMMMTEGGSGGICLSPSKWSAV